jgi:hypothetical protein
MSYRDVALFVKEPVMFFVRSSTLATTAFCGIIVLSAASCSSGKSELPIVSPEVTTAQLGMIDEYERADEDAWQIMRVGGDLDAEITGENGDYRFGNSRVDTKLPDGYPPPTPPGAIDLKRYPDVRRAEASGRVNPNLGMNLAFWPLFQHIQRNDVPMTAPVEMDYHGWDGDVAGPSRWTMSFLYPTRSTGTTGKQGSVEVVDVDPMTVASVGMTGRYHLSVARAGLDVLHAWLASQDEWEQAGDPRAMYYNDPSVRNDRKWIEMQIPVRRRVIE